MSWRINDIEAKITSAGALLLLSVATYFGHQKLDSAINDANGEADKYFANKAARQTVNVIPNVEIPAGIAIGDTATKDSLAAPPHATTKKPGNARMIR